VTRFLGGARYPPAFWLLFWGTWISATGGSMVWPFLTLYLRQRLATPLTQITMLLTLNAVTGLVVDRFGRKGAMVIGLLGSGLVMLGMIPAASLLAWAALMAFMGGFGPIYRVGGDAMVADLIEPSQRASAYALLRMIANLGVAVGPAIGGFIVSASYTLAFILGGLAQILFAALVLLRVRETRPSTPEGPRPLRRGEGYEIVLRDRLFLAFCGLYTLAGMAYALMMVLLPVYVKENYGVPERLYGFIMTTNAAMVVLTFGEKFGQGVVELGGILFGGDRSHGRGSAFGADREIHGRDLGAGRARPEGRPVGPGDPGSGFFADFGPGSGHAWDKSRCKLQGDPAIFEGGRSEKSPSMPPG